MFCIKYQTWKDVCNMYFSLKTGVKKSYIQWFPFTKLSYNDKLFLCSEEFYTKYIKSFSFLLFANNIYQSSNYIQKSDGGLRNASLVSPILYLTLQAIGKEIYDQYTSQRVDDISVYYAGNYEQMRPIYKQDYDNFFKEVNANISGYNYFIKTDISNFYSDINVNKLLNRIDNICNKISVIFSQSQLQIIKELLLYCGGGNFPLLENSIASSYLSTVIYLDDIDVKLHKFINGNKFNISDFKMIRYVDDMYILLSSNANKRELTNIYNEIRNQYSSLLKEYDLALNAKKCCLKSTVEINDELKKSLYDEYVNGEKRNIAELFPNSLEYFLDDLINEISSNGIDIDKYNELINKNFSSNDIEFTANEVFNYFIYDRNDIVKTEVITQKLVRLLNESLSFIYLDPKRLTILIMKNQNNTAIKAFLNQLFLRARAGKWNSFDTMISITYLIQSQFNHIDLLNVLKGQQSQLYDYYVKFCKSSFILTFKNEKTNKLQSIIMNDAKTMFLYFLFMCEYHKKNLMTAFAYFKNFFDRATADIDFYENKNSKYKKPNYNKFYQEKSLCAFYKNDQNSADIITKAHKLRNANPVSHSSSELLDDNNSSKDLIISIKNLFDLLLEHIT